MYIKKVVGPLEILRWNWLIIVYVFMTVVAVTILYLEVLEAHMQVSQAVLSSLGVAISFFIAFFTAQAYDRWWEARRIWGTIVNDSRSFGRMVVTMLPADRLAGGIPTRNYLIKRHIAFLYALKEQLRQETTREYLGYLNDRDAARAQTAGHVGNLLLELQGADLVAAHEAELIDFVRLAQFNDMLNRFSTSMGMAERIKLTVFPPHYEAMIRLSIIATLVVFPFSLSNEIGYWSIPYSFLIGSIFVLVYRVGISLVDPFEGRSGDTPMASIIRTIEINLLEQIGQDDLPRPVEPIDGRYLL